MTDFGNKFDVLIHLGAGQCRELSNHLRVANRIILVEPHPEVIELLQQRVETQANVEVLEAAVDNGNSEQVFITRNMREFSGFRPLDDMQTFYPGLQDTGELEIHKQDAGEFVGSLIRRRDRRISLVIDVNGDEAEVLESLAQAGLMERIEEIRVYCGTSALYKGGPASAEVEQLLSEVANFETRLSGSGFMRTVHAWRVRQPEAIPQPSLDETTELHKERDALQASLERLESRLSQLSERLVATESEKMELGSQLRQTQEDAQRNDRSEELEGLKRSLEGLRAENIKLTTRTASMKRSIEEAQTLRDELEAKAREAQRALDRERERHEAEIEALDQNFADREHDLKLSYDNEQDSLRSNLDLALRSQAMSAADLAAMQTRYADLMALKERQDDLLHRLQQRLAQASRYFASEQEPFGREDQAAQLDNEPADSDDSSEPREG